MEIFYIMLLLSIMSINADSINKIICKKKNYDPESLCLRCINHYDLNKDCIICEPHWSIGKECKSCVDHFNIDDNCISCVGPWYGKNCSHINSTDILENEVVIFLISVSLLPAFCLVYITFLIILVFCVKCPVFNSCFCYNVILRQIRKRQGLHQLLDEFDDETNTKIDIDEEQFVNNVLDGNKSNYLD